MIFLFLLLFVSCIQKQECNSCGIGRKKTITEFKLANLEYKIAIQSFLYDHNQTTSYFGVSPVNEDFFSQLLYVLEQQTEFEISDVVAVTLYINKKLSNYVLIESGHILGFSLYSYKNNYGNVSTFIMSENNYSLFKKSRASGISSTYHIKVLEDMFLPKSIQSSFITFYGVGYSELQ